MRLAISNIAWDASEDGEVATLLRRFHVDAIDIAPGKYFPDPAKVRDQDIAHVQEKWEGIEMIGMQALLFGTQGLNLFGPPHIQESMLKHLTSICRIGAGLGAKQLVFGSPKNRDRSGLSDLEAYEISILFFHRLGAIAQSFGVNICLEPIHPSCGANFMTTSVETAQLVEQIAHPAIKMQLDTGALTANEEDPIAIIPTYAPLIGHIHTSEPNLLPIGDGETNHNAVASVLEQYLPTKVVCIEMLATQDEPHLKSIERALKATTHYYRRNHSKNYFNGTFS